MPFIGRRSRFWLTLMLVGAAAAHAVEFDEKVKAPAAIEPAAFKSHALSYKTRIEALGAHGPLALLTDRQLAKDQLDLLWQFQDSLDKGQMAADVSELGFIRRDDGTYGIDYNAHPEWHRLDESIAGLLPVMEWDAFGQELGNRGFRPDDVAILRDYVERYDARQMAAQRTLPLAISFSKVVRKLDRVKRPVPDGLAMSYLYQRARVEAEVTRGWIDGLLQRLDAQRGRILVSYFAEMTSTAVIAADNRRAGIDELLRLMRSPNFEALATAEAQGVKP